DGARAPRGCPRDRGVYRRHGAADLVWVGARRATDRPDARAEVRHHPGHHRGDRGGNPMTLRVTPFVPSDYVRILEAAQIETPWIEDRLAHGRAYATHGPSYTIWAGDEIACTLGLVIHWRGRAYAWAVWGPAGYRHALGAHRLTVRYLRALRDRYRLLRIDADIVDGFTAGMRWAAHLDFEPRGEPEPFYGPGG